MKKMIALMLLASISTVASAMNNIKGSQRKIAYAHRANYHTHKHGQKQASNHKLAYARKAAAVNQSRYMRKNAQHNG